MRSLVRGRECLSFDHAAASPGYFQLLHSLVSAGLPARVRGVVSCLFLYRKHGVCFDLLFCWTQWVSIRPIAPTMPTSHDVVLVGVSHWVSCSIISRNYRQYTDYARAWVCTGTAWRMAYTLAGDFLQPIFKGQPEQGLAMVHHEHGAQWFRHCRYTRRVPGQRAKHSYSMLSI